MSSYLVASHYVIPDIQRCMGRKERREADAYRFLYEVQAVCTHVASAQLQTSKQARAWLRSRLSQQKKLREGREWMWLGTRQASRWEGVHRGRKSMIGG